MAYSQMVRQREEEKLIRRHIFPRVIFIYAHFAATALQKLFVSRDLISAELFWPGGPSTQLLTPHFMRAIKIKSRRRQSNLLLYEIFNECARGYSNRELKHFFG
jgi:hypothetical protein